MRRPRWNAGRAAIAAALVCVAASVAGAAPRSNRLKPKFETVFSAFLQRPLTIDSLRWQLHALRFVARGVHLWEEPSVLMAECPRVVMSISLKTLTSARLRVGEMLFEHPRAILRFDGHGRTNLTEMLAEIHVHSRRVRKPGHRPKVAYGVFEVRDGRLEVIDRDTGSHPFGAPFKVEARGRIHGLGPSTRFPFHLDAVLDSTATATRVSIHGTLARRPIVHVDAVGIPAQIAADFLPVMRYASGTVDAALDLSHAAAYRFWRIAITSATVRLALPEPFPVLSVRGLLHPYAPSRLTVAIDGQAAHFDASLSSPGLSTKEARVTLTGRGADLAECIRWCGTGADVAERLKGRPRGPVEQKLAAWRLEGRADVDASFASVAGPELLRRANGRLDFRLQDGAVIDAPGFRKVMALLNLSAALVGVKDRETGLRFGTVTGTVDLKNGIAETRNLIVLQSDTLNVGVSGRVDFPQRLIDANFLIGVVSLPESLISQIPFVRRFSDGKKKGVIPLWLSVQGRWENPTVRLRPLRSFDRRLWKTLPSGFQIPDRELKRIYG